MKTFLLTVFALLQLSHHAFGQNAQACSAGCNRFAIPRCQRYIGTLGFFCAADTAATAAYIATLDDKAAATNDSWTNWKPPSTTVTNVYSVSTGGAAPIYLVDSAGRDTGFLGRDNAGAASGADSAANGWLVTYTPQPNYPPWQWIRTNELLTAYTTSTYALAGSVVPLQSIYHNNIFWFPQSYSSFMTYSGPFNLRYPNTQCLQMYQGLICADTFNGATIPGTLNSLDVCSPVDNFIKPAMCFTSCKSFLTTCGVDLFKYTATNTDGSAGAITNIAYNGNAAALCNELVNTGVVAQNGFTQCYSLNASALAVRISYVAALLSCIVSLAFLML